MESSVESTLPTSINSTVNSGSHVYDDNEVNTRVWRSKTLRRFGIGHIVLGCLGMFLRLGSIVFKYKWLFVVPGIFCSLLEIPLGILGFVAGTNLEDRCYLITSNAMSIILAIFGFSNIALQAIAIDQDSSKVIFSSVLIVLSAAVGILSTFTAFLCSRYTIQTSNSCCFLNLEEDEVPVINPNPNIALHL